jgi:hypothetical protein
MISLIITSVSQVKSSVRKDGLTQQYFTVGVTPAKKLGNKVLKLGKEVSRTINKQFKFEEGVAVKGTDKWDKLDPETAVALLEANTEIDAILQGEVFTEEVVPFEINGKLYKAATTFTLDFMNETKEQAFKAVGKTLISEAIKANPLATLTNEMLSKTIHTEKHIITNNVDTVTGEVLENETELVNGIKLPF